MTESLTSNNTISKSQEQQNKVLPQEIIDKILIETGLKEAITMKNEYAIYNTLKKMQKDIDVNIWDYILYNAKKIDPNNNIIEILYNNYIDIIFALKREMPYEKIELAHYYIVNNNISELIKLNEEHSNLYIDDKSYQYAVESNFQDIINWIHENKPNYVLHYYCNK